MDKHKHDYARMRAVATATKATTAQITYLEILLNDCGFGARAQRNAFLSREVEREITAVGELTLNEARTMIEQLIVRKREVQGTSGSRHED